MSLEAVLDAIRAAGDAQVSEIEARSRAGAEDILRMAREDSERSGEEARLTALAPAAKEGIRIAQQAQFNASQITIGVQEALIGSAIQGARQRLVDIRSDKTYPALLHRLTYEALSELRRSLQESEEIHLEADLRDHALLQGVLNEFGSDLQVSYTLTTWGGVIASSEDGRIVVSNTLEARLERALPYLRRHLALSVPSNLSVGIEIS